MILKSEIAYLLITLLEYLNVNLTINNNYLPIHIVICILNCRHEAYRGILYIIAGEILPFFCPYFVNAYNYVNY